MKKRIVHVILSLAIVFSLCIEGCKRQLYDNEQLYHPEYERLERLVNQELGDYLSITRYQFPEENHLYIEVYLRSSYCDNTTRVEETPIWLVVDRFRCVCNEFLRDNPGYFGDSYTKIDCVFERDFGDYNETVASIRNHITSYDNYAIFVTESVEYGYVDVDYSLLQNKEDIVCLYMGYHGDIENPTTEECYDYFCEQIEMFPSLEYIFILPISSDNADNQEVIQMLLDSYELILLM